MINSSSILTMLVKGINGTSINYINFVYTDLFLGNPTSVVITSNLCPIGGCPLPPSPLYDNITAVWSNADIWPGKVLPQESDDVTIPKNW